MSSHITLQHSLVAASCLVSLLACGCNAESGSAKPRQGVAARPVAKPAATPVRLISEAGARCRPDDEPYRVSARIIAPHAAKRHMPDLRACSAWTGTVVLESVIAVDGSPQKIRVVHGGSECVNAAAVDAFSQWRFCPAESGGVPVEIKYAVTMKIKIPDRRLQRPADAAR